MGIERLDLFLEGRVAPRFVIGAFQVEDQRHQRLGDEPAAEQAEEAQLVGATAIGVELHLFALLSLRSHDENPQFFCDRHLLLQRGL